MAAEFETSVFINCPFDKAYEPILQAILFGVVYAGLNPRIANEDGNAAMLRLDKIRGLIEASKYSIHDLSRCQAKKRGEHFRLNMPFELGIDYGCRQYFGHGREHKKILILEEQSHRYLSAISDLAGCDIQSHAGNFEVAVRKIRNWLVNEAQLELPGASRVLASYYDFQEWYYEKQLAAGFSEEDIRDYSTGELLVAMKRWVAEGRPI